jgi:hypothetical protein
MMGVKFDGRTIECLRSDGAIVQRNKGWAEVSYFRWIFRCINVTTIAIATMTIASGMVALLNSVLISIISVA